MLNDGESPRLATNPPEAMRLLSSALLRHRFLSVQYNVIT